MKRNKPVHDGIKTMFEITNEESAPGLYKQINYSHCSTTLLSKGSNFIGTQSQLIKIKNDIQQVEWGLRIVSVIIYIYRILIWLIGTKVI